VLQEAKQIRLVRQQFVEAAIQSVLGGDSKVLAQQIAHCGLPEPLPMQPPFAARIDQPIAN
jgi:hypothetical protein